MDEKKDFENHELGSHGDEFGDFHYLYCRRYRTGEIVFVVTMEANGIEYLEFASHDLLEVAEK